MASVTSIEAEARERAGKGAARASRRAGKVPAVIYGAKQAPTLCQLDPRIIMRELHRGGWRSRLFELNVGGQPARALMREVQFHPVSDRPIHVDFQRLAPGEKIRLSIAVHFQNEGISPGIKRGGLLNVVRHSVDVLADPDIAPEAFIADVGGLDINQSVHWEDLTGTEGVTLAVSAKDIVIATITPPTKSVEPTAEAAPAAPTAPAKGAAPAKAPAKPAAKK